MERDDVQLIRSTLSGDDAAFNTLVKKYQKGVHALAWRKIGDFHYAEEITQDTFLQAYKKLSTLKNPNQFAGWLYVIANRLCLNWMRKQKPAMQSLEGTSAAEAERFSYTHHVSEHRETEASEHRSEIVKKLLTRLPESERTVMTLYYLSEMPAKEIGKFLGVSVKTVHSRLHRARKRLEDKEELLVHEVLSSIQLSTDLTENIMREVADLKPTPPPAAKPLLPWAAFGAATVLIVLLLGASNQYLVRFQQPYSFEARSEPTIEIVDTFIVVDIDAKPTVRNQVGRADTPSKSSSAGLQNTEIASTSDTQDDLAKFSNSQWNRTNGPYGGAVHDIFVTSDKTLYAAAPTGIYRLTPDATAWTLINTNVQNDMYRTPIAEHDNALYIVSTDHIFASTDNGETWNILCSRPKGHPVGLIVMDEIQGRNSAPRAIMYLALQDKGIFRSTDAGVQWNLLKNGLAGKHIYAMAAIENTVFASTNEGLYRLNSDVWQQLQVNTSGPIYWIVGFENNLYIEVGHDSLIPEWLAFESKQKDIERLVLESDVRSNRIFHSTDFGTSWTEITHKNEPEFMSPSHGVMFLADTGETLLPQGIVAAEKNTFYRASPLGIYRTTDSGKSWHPFMNGIIGTTIHDLIAMNDTLYVNTGRDFLQSANGGETWETVRIDANNQTLEAIQQIMPYLHFASSLAVANDVLYGVVPEKHYQRISELSKDGIISEPEKDHLRIFQLSMRDNVLAPVQGAPTFERESPFVELWTADHLPNNGKSDTSIGIKYEEIGGFGGLAVTGKTFYAEYKRQLFKWNRGDPEWTDTGLIDTTETPKYAHDNSFKLAASGETVYVGKRDGTLFQSLDSGKSWKNITPTLPLHYTHLKEITFAGSTIYVVTDKGVLSSQTGVHWRVLTDKMGQQTMIDSLAVDGTTVYGANNRSGIYRLDTDDRWKQIAPSIPDKVRDLAVNNGKLYIATPRSGIFHISLETQ